MSFGLPLVGGSSGAPAAHATTHEPGGSDPIAPAVADTELVQRVGAAWDGISVASIVASATVRTLGQDRGTGANRALASTSGLTGAGDRMELESSGAVDAGGTIRFGLGATTLYTSTAVAPGGASYVARCTIVRVTDTTADWFAHLAVEGSVCYAGRGTAAAVPSLSGGVVPFASASGATSTTLNMTGTLVKA